MELGPKAHDEIRELIGGLYDSSTDKQNIVTGVYDKNAAIEWSWLLMTPSELVVLSQLLHRFAIVKVEVTTTSYAHGSGQANATLTITPHYATRIAEWLFQMVYSLTTMLLGRGVDLKMPDMSFSLDFMSSLEFEKEYGRNEYRVVKHVTFFSTDVGLVLLCHFLDMFLLPCKMVRDFNACAVAIVALKRMNALILEALLKASDYYRKGYGRESQAL